MSNSEAFLNSSMAGAHSTEKIELRLAQEAWDLLDQIAKERDVGIGEAASWHVELGLYFALLRKEALESNVSQTNPLPSEGLESDKFSMRFKADFV